MKIKRLLLMLRGEILKKKLLRCGKHIRIEKDYEIYGQKNIIIGDNFYANKGLRLEAYASDKRKNPIIDIGDNVSLGQNCHIGGINSIKIEKGVLIGSKVYITDHMHGNPHKHYDNPPAKRELYSKGSVLIGENTWIGDNVVVLPGVKIGKNVIIGANAVVTKDISDNVTAVGVPARTIEY